MLTILVVDSELETIPEEMWNDPAVRKYSVSRKKSPKNILLDSNFLHSSIERFFPGMSVRRGRPDIFHMLLNVVNESILNREGKLRVFIHTRNNKVITVNPETRLPKSYNRFVGLIEDLFLKGMISYGEKSLLQLENLTAGEMIRKYSTGKNIVLWPAGQSSSPDSMVDGENTTLIIGGFAEGDFLSDLSFLSERYSIYHEELTIWSVAAELICSYERVHGIL